MEGSYTNFCRHDTIDFGRAKLFDDVGTQLEVSGFVRGFFAGEVAVVNQSEAILFVVQQSKLLVITIVFFVQKSFVQLQQAYRDNECTSEEYKSLTKRDFCSQKQYSDNAQSANE